MRPNLSPEQLDTLPLTNRLTIPESFLDEMGHMNIQYYVHVYDRAAWGLIDWLGMTFEDFKQRDDGMFALQQFIQYLAEVHVGETVAVRSRILGISEKRLHYMHFMVNETTNTLASTFEVLASYADLSARRTAPFPQEIKSVMQTRLDEHNNLNWDAPICGVLRA